MVHNYAQLLTAESDKIRTNSVVLYKFFMYNINIRLRTYFVRIYVCVILPGEEAKQQWFKLRKTFKKKLVKLPSGSEAPKKSTRWPWWDNMQFAKDAVTTNK